MTLGNNTGRGLPRWVEAPVAALLLLGCAPLLLPLLLAIRLGSPGPALFRQQRVGRFGRPFTLIKLRTMRVTTGGTDRPQDNVTARGDHRITALGRILRSSKLDELPELWNIVRGELSFVGPRPEVPALVQLEDARWQKVLEVRPGLTDPVTLRLRNEENLLAEVTEDRELFYRQVLQPWKLDGYLEYLGRRSAGSDLTVLFETLLAILWPQRAPPPSVDEIRRGFHAR